MSGPPRPNATVSLHVLGDGGALMFHERAQALFALNQTAAYLWSRLEEGLAPQDLAADLVAQAATPRDEAERLVAQCLDDWRRHALLDDGEPGDYPGYHGRRRTVPTDAGRIAPPGVVALTRTVHLPGLDVRVRYATATLADRVRPMLAHLERLHPARSGPVDTTGLTLDVTGTPGSYLVLADGREFARCRTRPEIAPLVKAALAIGVLERGGHDLALHAAAVVRHGRCLLLPGAAGVGKTTLALALAAHGFGFVADDTVLFDAHALTIRGLPFRPAVKEGAWRFLLPLYPALDHLPVHRRPDGQSVRYLPPPAGAPAPGQAHPVSWIVFPRPGSDAAVTALTRISQTEALRRLLSEAYAPSHRLTGATLVRLVRAFRAIECHEMTASNLDEAVHLMLDLCR